jgi:uncharacterized protein (TIGR02453 family)
MNRLNEQGQVISFNGFSPEAFVFLRKLKRNNRREWFQPRKPLYEKLLREPMEALLLELGERIEPQLPGIRFHPKKHIFRIYRDVRFSEDKSPYKDHLAANPRFPSNGINERPGFYLHVAPGEVFVAGGLYMPDSAQLVKIRTAIAEKPRPFIKVIHELRFKKYFGELQGERLKRAPKGFPPDHPRIQYLQLKQFFVSARLNEKVALKRQFLDKTAVQLEAMIPLLRWIESTLSTTGSL